MTRPQYVYHWTHRGSVASILQRGLDPEYTTGARVCVWACEAQRVLWAVAHVSAHHGHSPDDMVLLRVAVVGDGWRRASYPHVWTCDEIVPPHRIAVVRRIPVSRSVPRVVRP